MMLSRSRPAGPKHTEQHKEQSDDSLKWSDFVERRDYTGALAVLEVREAQRGRERQREAQRGAERQRVASRCSRLIGAVIPRRLAASSEVIPPR